MLTTTATAAPTTGPQATNGAQGAAKPTVVLVHGGFADASASWNDVIKRLQRDGYPVVAPANPLRGLSSDAPYLAGLLKSIKGPVILAGHSYGGAVITNAAAGNPNVKAPVYVAAFVPDEGEQLIGLLGKYPGSEIPDAINEVPFTGPDGTTGTDIYLKADKFRSAFAADLPRSVTDVMHAAQRPAAATHLTDPTRAAAWRDIPSWGPVAAADKAIPPALQRWEYDRANMRGQIEVRGLHTPSWSATPARWRSSSRRPTVPRAEPERPPRGQAR
ncbi:alpha/beta fold hydrolase [Streptomyces sp. NPDC057539]|uniref:alpha/beta hydrolase n=1 Tax=Streptomyces sp. NPDC057539 TaxID=3346159 RepID=UPI003682BD84